ncbi:MAG TPA: hypothetical protein VMT88_09740 [Actinomycetes bacterium]|nr:hypothetical protein [Actinomycetes bacterium]
MRRVVLAGALVVLTCSVASLAACTGSTSTETEQTTLAKGTLTGLVTMSGGPVNLQGQPALHHDPARNWSVTVRSDAKVVSTTSTDAQGRFSFELSPGTYQVKCLDWETFVVRSGETTTANCHIPVP